MAFTWNIDLQQLRATMEGLADGFIAIDLEGRIVYMNRAAQHLFGFRSLSEAETKSANLRDYMLSTFELRQPTGERLSEDEQPIVRALQGETFTDLTYQVSHRDSQEIKWFSFSGTRVAGNTERQAFGLLTLRDVTAQKQSEGRERGALAGQAEAEADQAEAEQDRSAAETARQEAETRYDIIFETNPAPTLVCRLGEGRAVAVNDGFLEMTGYLRDEVMGKDVPDLDLFATKTTLTDTLDAIRRGDTVAHAEVQIRHKRSQTVTAVVSAKAIEIAGEACGILTFIDISELESMTRQLQEARLRLANVRERERLSLARELHDDVIQNLIGLSYELAGSAKDAARNTKSTEALAEAFDQHRRSVLAVVQSLRHLISGLRPVGLEDLGLQAALENYVTQLQSERASTAPAVTFEFAKNGDVLPRQIALCFYRTAQESLRNVRSHAQASRVWINLSFEGEDAVLNVRDDGRGFHVPDSYTALEREHHFGLAGSNEYLASLGGSLHITSQPGQGTTATARLPLKSPLVE